MHGGVGMAAGGGRWLAVPGMLLERFALPALWLALVPSAAWVGLTALGRVEAAGLLVGCVVLLLLAVEHFVAEPRSGGRHADFLFAFAAGLIGAPLFDWFDVSALGLADWSTGFLAAFVPALLLARVFAARGTETPPLAPGERPWPQWDALWLLATVLVAQGAVGLARSLGAADGGQAIAVVPGGVLVAMAALVHWVRYGRLLGARLALAALAGAALAVVANSGRVPDAAFAVSVLALPVLPLAAGGYAWREPGVGLLRTLLANLAGMASSFAIFAVLAFGVLPARDNATVAATIADLGELAPLDRLEFGALVLRDVWLWADAPPAGSADGADPLMAALSGDRADRHSLVLPAGVGARRVGPAPAGFDTVWRNGERRVSFVAPDSPAEAAGVERGWLLVPASTARREARAATGGAARRGDAADEAAAAFAATGAAGAADDDAALWFRDHRGALRRLVPPAEDIHWSAVAWRIERDGAHAVGYLYLGEFSHAYAADLDAVFAVFRAAGVDRLIVDLRYNPGGSTDMVVHLASLAVGASHAGRVALRTLRLPRYRDLDTVEHVAALPGSLAAQRVAVLTTRESCSASEALAVSLRALVPLAIVGERTCGKPVGSRPMSFRGTRFHVIEFRVGAEGRIGYYDDGLQPDCPVPDELARPLAFGTRDDPAVAAALAWLRDGRCAGTAPQGDGAHDLATTPAHAGMEAR